MMNFKNGKVSPLFDFYTETDLDDVDDQLVDYSKRYADSIEVCDSSRAMNRDQKPAEDEMKVYCLEGTPLLISSASSMCDLRDIGSSGVAPEVTSSKEHVQTPKSDNGAADSSEKCSKQAEKENAELTSKEKNNILSVEENVSFTNEESGTKASSPLMFSRSSSVGSLNSFEQHSIVDDRSSVSAFSTFMSGIISPSEIPDSPGEVMTPPVPKGNKQISFQFPAPENEKTLNVILEQLKKNTSDFISEAFENQDEDDMKVYNEEGDCSAASNLSALSMQTNSIRVTVNVKQKVSFNSNLVSKSDSKLNEPCDINSRIAETYNTDSRLVRACDNNSKSNEKIYSKNYELTEFSRNDRPNQFASCQNFKPVFGSGLNVINQRNNEFYQNVSMEKKCKDIGTSTSEDFELLNNSFHSIKSSTGQNNDKISFSQETQTTEKSKDASDDEDNALLDACIKSGKPFKDNKQKPTDYMCQNKTPVKERNTKRQNSLSDQEASGDEGDYLFEQCIQLGMPQKKRTVHDISKPICSTNQNTNQEIHMDTSSNRSPNSPLNLSIANISSIKKMSNQHIQRPQKDSIPLQNSMKRCTPIGNDQPKSSRRFPGPSTLHSAVNKNREISKVESGLCNSRSSNAGEKVSHNNNQFCLQKAHYNPCNINSKSCAVPSFVSIDNLGYRDNCPDGTSDDEDDDDNMLTECIMAGRPRARVNSNAAKQNTYSKPPNQKPLSAESRPQLKKTGYSNLQLKNQILRTASASTHIEADSTCEYMTEDTPILSPTASISDLSTLSFTEDKSCQESFLNNSRNSDCSSESDDDDELLLQCIRSGRPGEEKFLV